MTSVQEPAAASAIAPAITFRQLTVVAGRQTLLQNVDAVFQAGKVTLIIGCSGVGKSVLLNAMADLIRDDDDVTVTGEVTRNGASVGVVFQSFALLAKRCLGGRAATRPTQGPVHRGGAAGRVASAG